MLASKAQLKYREVLTRRTCRYVVSTVARGISRMKSLLLIYLPPFFSTSKDTGSIAKERLTQEEFMMARYKN
jgi:hypothetical protein